MLSVAIDFIVPTLYRPLHLERCLIAIDGLDGCQPRVFVGIRKDDSSSFEVVDRFHGGLNVVAVEAGGVGVVGSMNSCLGSCSAPLIALVDDDVELPSHWAVAMLTHLGADSEAVGVSGRDLLMDHPEMRRTEPLVRDVGRIRSIGRITGNHHRAGGSPRRVDILRGSNCLYRGAFLKNHGFEKSLAGTGAQVNWELALALQARKQGKRLFFDPTVHVLHHVAPRQDNDTVHRGVFNAGGTSDIAHNEALVVLKHGRGFTRIMLLLWQLAIGSHTCPGILRLPKELVSTQVSFWARYRATMSGRCKAIKTLLSGEQLAG